jgi:hypothetical protein
MLERGRLTARDGFNPPFMARKRYWHSVDLAITCPRCGAEAKFLPATIKELSRSKIQPIKKAGAVEVFELSHENWNGSFHAPFFGVFYHGMGHSSPEGWEAPKRWATDVGTLRCSSCGLCRRHHLDFPASAYFQLDFDGHFLFLYNRDHVSGLIDLLEAKIPRGLPWCGWFNNTLPEQFKSAKARKVLPGRLRKLLA